MPALSRALFLIAGVSLMLAAMLSAYGFHGLPGKGPTPSSPPGPGPTSSKTAFFNGNTLVVVGGDGVLVVDSGDALPVTRKTIAEIKRLTPLPVRFLGNTHWHWDHTLGNGEYRAAFPGVTIISTTATRDLMDTRGRANLADSIAAIPPYLDSLRQALDAGKRRDGTPLTPADRESIQAQLDDLGRGLQCYKDARVTLPDVTFDRELTVRLGSRAVTSDGLAAAL